MMKNQARSSLAFLAPPLGMLRQLWVGGVQGLNVLQPVCLLLARLYVARVFFLSGLTKIRDWDTTLLLFSNDYQVPLLPASLAALLGTAGELVLPVLLVLGLLGRIGALGLFVVNAVAVWSLPDMPEAAYMLHLFWGSLLLGLAVFGPGRLSLDAVLQARLRAY